MIRAANRALEMTAGTPHELYLASLAPNGDQPLDIGVAALTLAAFDHADRPLDHYHRHLDELAQATVEAADAGATPTAALAGAIAGRFGYVGDAETYDDTQNADLIRVIDRRRGLPVALAILYLHAARARGWNAVGLNFPHHFLIRIEGNDVREIIDPFHGGVALNAGELRVLLKRVAGEDAELQRHYFDAVSDRSVLLRLENNIKSRALIQRNYGRAAEVVRRMLLFAPDHIPLWRDASIASFQLGEVNRALKLAEEYFIRAEDSTTRNDAARLIQKLQRNLN